MNLKTATITGLAHDCRGIAHINGKITFIRNGLPGEEVAFQYEGKHQNYDEGNVVEILQNPSPDRVEPLCPFFHCCGGCSLQHISTDAQIAQKNQIMLEQLQHFGETTPLSILPPLTGPAWHYRSRARLSVKYLLKKDKLLVGFHEKNGRFVAEIDRCLILEQIIGDKIRELRELVAALTIRGAIPQIEVAVGDGEGMTGIATLVFRHLTALPDDDRHKLAQFAAAHGIQIFLQPHSIDSIHPLSSSNQQLSYKLPDFDVELFFHPTDFTQINKTINRKLVSRTKELLDPNPNDHILDLFCGLGNFTLPLAKFCQKIVGIEGSQQMVTRAKANATHNGIDNAEFFCADLASEMVTGTWTQNRFTKILLDPPRTGAIAIIRQISKFGAQKIIYISCNPATFARDAKELIGQGYRLLQTGIIDMFPHTKHVEAMGEFVKNK